jgi:transposase-like protein
MNPETQFCHNPECPARGLVGQDTISIHSRTERRYRCLRCGKTFAATTGTPLYRLKHTLDVVTLVLTLLTHGCPTQAIVAAFGFDERTIAAWLERAGQHAKQVHHHLVALQPIDIQHVQADELWVKRQGGRLWQAMALAVPSRFWLGGVISPHRDGKLLIALVKQVRAAARDAAIVVCVDGLASYVTCFTKVFRRRVPQARGRPRLEVEEGLLLGQVIKRRCKRAVTSVTRRVVLGSEQAISSVLRATGTGTCINTAYIERLNATFRSKLALLVRRSRTLARRQELLEAGMWLVGVSYNFCWLHHSLRVRGEQATGSRWRKRTPAMAAGVTDHRWTLRELMCYQVPPPPWVAPKRRGRPHKQPVPHAPTATTL